MRQPHAIGEVTVHADLHRDDDGGQREDRRRERGALLPGASRRHKRAGLLDQRSGASTAKRSPTPPRAAIWCNARDTVPNLDWKSFRALPGASWRNWELLCHALIHRNYGRYGNLVAVRVQPVVEFHLTLTEDCPGLGERGEQWGWQCKFWEEASPKLNSSRKKVLTKAFKNQPTHLPELDHLVIWTHQALRKTDWEWIEENAPIAGGSDGSAACRRCGPRGPGSAARRGGWGSRWCSSSRWAPGRWLVERPPVRAAAAAQWRGSMTGRRRSRRRAQRGFAGR
jgi:hypothetical protein